MLASIKKMMAVVLFIIIQPKEVAIITKNFTICLTCKFNSVPNLAIVSASNQCDDSNSERFIRAELNDTFS